jgi:hypothetical protein
VPAGRGDEGSKDHAPPALVIVVPKGMPPESKVTVRPLPLEVPKIIGRAVVKIMLWLGDVMAGFGMFVTVPVPSAAAVKVTAGTVDPGMVTLMILMSAVEGRRTGLEVATPVASVWVRTLVVGNPSLMTATK